MAKDKKFTIEIRTKGFSRANKNLKDVTTQTRSLSRESNKASTAMATFRRTTSQLRNNLLLVGFAIGSATMAFSKFIEAASGFETVKARLVGLMGSVEGAERAFRTFNQVASTTPFDLMEIVQAGAQLKAFGADAEELIKVIADLAAHMETSAVEAANAFGRAYAGGAGAADIFREKGILNIIKDFKGIENLTDLTLPQFREAMIAAFNDPSTGIAGSTDRMSKTFRGALSNMSDAVLQLSAEIGDILLPAIKAGMLSTTEMATNARRAIRGMRNALSEDFITMSESIKQFEARIEIMSLEDLEKESQRLQKVLKDNKVVIDGNSTGIVAIDESIKNTNKSLQTFSVFTDKSTNNLINLKDGYIITSVFSDEMKQALEQQNTTMATTNSAYTIATEKVKKLNERITEEKDRNIELEDILKAFPELYKDTDEAKAEKLKTTIDIIEKYREEFTVSEQVVAVLKKLKAEYASLTIVQDLSVDQFKEYNRVQREIKKELKELADAEEERLAKLQAHQQQMDQFASSILVAAGALKTLGDSSTTPMQKLSALMQTLGGILMMMPGMQVSGAILQAGSMFIGHTGGLIKDNGIQRFATGGMVQGQDNVPIMAQAGEFIMQRSAVQNIGVDNLADMNKTGNVGSSINVNITGGVVDESYVNNELIPAINKATSLGNRINA